MDIVVSWHVHSRSALYWLHADMSPLPADAVRLAGTIVGELFALRTLVTSFSA